MLITLLSVVALSLGIYFGGFLIKYIFNVLFNTIMLLITLLLSIVDEVKEALEIFFEDILDEYYDARDETYEKLGWAIVPRPGDEEEEDHYEYYDALSPEPHSFDSLEGWGYACVKVLDDALRSKDEDRVRGALYKFMDGRKRAVLESALLTLYPSKFAFAVMDKAVHYDDQTFIALYEQPSDARYKQWRVDYYTNAMMNALGADGRTICVSGTMKQERMRALMSELSASELYTVLSKLFDWLRNPQTHFRIPGDELNLESFDVDNIDDLVVQAKQVGVTIV